MKVRNSLKALLKRHRDNKLVRRHGRVTSSTRPTRASRRARVKPSGFQAILNAVNGQTVLGALFIATSRGNHRVMRGMILIPAFHLFLLGLPGPAHGEVFAPAPTVEAAPPEDAATPPVTGDVSAAPKPPKPAEVRAEQLDILLARLYTSEGTGTDGLEQKIWSLWNANDSTTAEVLLAQAARAMNDGAPAEALKILDRVIGANPDYAEAWNKRATLYYMMKRDEASLKDIDKVLDLEPRHFGALAGKGMVLQRQKKYGPALDAFKQALAINPGLESVIAAIKDLQRLEQGI